MSKRVSIERVYPLGEYKNIKIIIEQSDLSDDADINKVFNNLFAHAEKAYIEYKLLNSEVINKDTVDEAIQYLETKIEETGGN